MSILKPNTPMTYNGQGFYPLTSADQVLTAAGGTVQRALQQAEERLQAAVSRLENLETAAKGQLYTESVDDAPAYYKTAPASALPFAEIMSMGGAVSRVRVTGKNLFNKDNAHILPNTVVNASVVKTQKASVETLCIWLPCAPNTQYAVSKLPGGKRFAVGDSVTVPGQNTVLNKATANNNLTSFKYTTSADARYMVVYAWLASAETVLSKDEVLNSLQVELDSVTAYEPYREAVYPIHDAIRALPGYGAVAGDVYNEVDCHNRQYIQRVGVAEPVVTDLSDILPAPFYVASGIAAFEQADEARAAVPSSVKYAVKV